MSLHYIRLTVSTECDVTAKDHARHVPDEAILGPVYTAAMHKIISFHNWQEQCMSVFTNSRAL